MPASTEFLDHLLVESWNIIWLAAGHQPSVHHDFLVDPFCSRVAEVGPDSRPGCHGLAPDQTRADKHLWSVTNGRHRFAFAEEMARKFERFVTRTQRIRIHQTARDHKRIKFLTARLVQR